MEVGGGGMERWREMFRGADIYDVIRNAILIAGADSPGELLRRRPGIVEWLFTVAPVPPLTCNSPGKGEQLSRPGSARSTSEKSSKEVSCNGAAAEPGDDDDGVDGGKHLPLWSAIDTGGHFHDNANAGAAGEAEAPSHPLIDQQMLEALADEIEEDNQVINEVLRIKEILVNYKEQSVDTLFDGLRRLQLMQLSVSILKSTEIVYAVAPLKKHRSPVICKIVRELTEGWKMVAVDWVGASSANAGKLDISLNTSNPSAAGDFSNPSTVEDDFGLPIPPIDMGAFFLHQSTAEQYVSELLVEVDDDDGDLIPDAKNSDGPEYKSQNNDLNTSKPTPAMHVMRKHQKETALRQTKPKKLMVNANGNSVPKIQGLRTRQAPTMGQTNLQQGKTQGSGSYIKPSRSSAVTTKPTKPRHVEHTLRSQPDKEIQKKHSYNMKPRQSQDHATVVRKPPPIAAVRKPLAAHKLGMQAPALEGHKAGIGKRLNTNIADLGLEATKRKLNHAYQEAENEKKKRCVQYLDVHEVPNFQQRRATTSTSKQKRNRTDDRFRVYRSRK